MGALILPQIPDPHIPPSIARNQLPLVRMDDHIVDRTAVQIIALYAPCPRIPDLHRTVFGARHHPFALAVERHACDVAGVAIESEHGARIGGADVVEFDVVVACCGEVALVG